MLNKILDIYLGITASLFLVIVLLLGILGYKIKLLVNYIFKKEIFKLQHSHEFFSLCGHVFLMASGNDIKINFLGEKYPKSKSVIYTYTHASSIEPMIMYSYLPIFPRSLAKIQLYNTPLVRDILNFTNSIPINNNNLNEALKVLKNVENELEKGTIISIAPEGKRRIERSVGKPNQLLPFKKGAFVMAKNVENVSIVPVIFYGAGRIMPFGQMIPNARSTCYIDILPEITPEEIKKYDYNQLKDKVENEIKKNYKNYPDSKIFNGGLGIKYNILCHFVLIFSFYFIKKILFN